MGLSRFRRPEGDENENVIGPKNLNVAARDKRYFYETFMQEPVCWKNGEALVAPGGTDAQVNVASTENYRFYFTNVGEATAVFEPVLATDGGWIWNTAAALAQGSEINFGGFDNTHPRNFLSSEKWFFRTLWIVDDVSGVDLTVGFRKVATTVATLTEITDMYGIRILGDSSSALAATSVVTQLNNGGTSDYVITSLSNTLTDATVIELETRVVNRIGAALINGAQVGEAASYTFDTGDYLSPFALILQSTDLADQIKLLAVEGGPLEERRRGSLLSLARSTD